MAGAGVQAVSAPRGTKAPAVTHSILLGLVVALVAAVALVVRAPSPPAIAEFAPQAVKQIEDAPDNQVSEFGEGEGACTEGVVCENGRPVGSATTTTTAPGRGQDDTIELPSVLNCSVDSNPPRQIEDPQSPPCMPYWKGDNGGATAKGVTATTINVAWPSPIYPQQHLYSIVDFFNSRFQFYGRKINFQPTSIDVAFGEPTGPAQMQATAVKVDKELNSFASLGFYEYGVYGQSSYYYDELARRGIVSVAGDDSFRTERDNYSNEAYADYQWSYVPSLDDLERNLGRWICLSLVGQLPVHAGQPYYPGGLSGPQPRKFGVVQQTRLGRSVDIEPLLETLSACDVTPEVQQLDVSGGEPAQQGLIARFNSEKQVSSVICICDVQILRDLQINASRAGYEPEWLIYGAQNHISDANSSGLRQSHRMFGINGTNKSNPLTQEPWFWAVKAMNPNADAARENAPTLGDPLYYAKFYHEMLLLASGIQQAGPNLTPETFAEGLMRTRFPNPGAGGPPYYQAAVGFGPNDHSMIRDVTLGWFDRSRRSDFTGHVGSFCYVDRGVRYSISSWKPVPADRFHPGGNPAVPCK